MRPSSGFTLLELVIVVALFALLLTVGLPLVQRSVEASDRIACQDNLKQIGIALKMYANESAREFMPPIKTVDCAGKGYDALNFMFDGDALFPDYLSDFDTLVCPGSDYGRTAVEQFDEGRMPGPHWREVAGYSGNGVVEPCEVTSGSYVYYGYGMHSEYWRTPESRDILFDSMESLFERVVVAGETAAVHGKMPFREQMNFQPRSHPMREGLLPYFNIRTLVDAGPGPKYPQYWQYVVLHERVSEPERGAHRVPEGVNVLMSDGHVKFVRFAHPGEAEEFPFNEAGRMLQEFGGGTAGR